MNERQILIVARNYREYRMHIMNWGLKPANVGGTAVFVIDDLALAGRRDVNLHFVGHYREHQFWEKIDERIKIMRSMGDISEEHYYET